MSRRANKANRRTASRLLRKAWEPRAMTAPTGESVSVGLTGVDAAVIVATLATLAINARGRR